MRATLVWIATLDWQIGTNVSNLLQVAKEILESFKSFSLLGSTSHPPVPKVRIANCKLQILSQVQFSGPPGQDPLPPPHFQYSRPSMPESQIGGAMPSQLGGPMPNQMGGPIPAQLGGAMNNQMGVPVQNQGSPILPSHSPGYRGPPGPGPQAPRMPRGPPYMDQGPPDGMMGPLPSPRYDGRPMDPAWPPRGDPSGEKEWQRPAIEAENSK